MNVMASDLIIRNEYHRDMLIFHEKHIQSSINESLLDSQYKGSYMPLSFHSYMLLTFSLVWRL